MRQGRQMHIEIVIGWLFFLFKQNNNIMDNVYKTIEDILEWKRKVENRSMVKCECINELPKNATYSQYLEAKEHDRRIIEGYVGEIMDVL